MKYCCELMEEAMTWGLIHYCAGREARRGYFLGEHDYYSKGLAPKFHEPFVFMDYCPFCGATLEEKK